MHKINVKGNWLPLQIVYNGEQKTSSQQHSSHTPHPVRFTAPVPASPWIVVCSTIGSKKLKAYNHRCAWHSYNAHVDISTLPCLVYRKLPTCFSHWTPPCSSVYSHTTSRWVLRLACSSRITN